MNFIFNYSEKTELERVKYTITNKERFKKYGYKTFMPAGFDLDSNDFSKLEEQIKKELNPAIIKHAEIEITQNWKKNSVYINKFLNDFPHEAPKEIIIQFTKYGVGGSYQPPNLIIMNINYNKDYFGNIFHEFIHCIIERPVVLKHGLDHAEKEGLVDWLIMNEKNLKKIFPQSRYQSISTPPSTDFIKKIGWESFTQT